MSCEHVRDLLSAYLDNQLTAIERQNVASHLALCAECSTILADYRRFDALLAHLPRIAAPTTLDHALFPSKDLLQRFNLDNRHVSSKFIPDVYTHATTWAPLPVQQVALWKQVDQITSYLPPSTAYAKTPLPLCSSTSSSLPTIFRRQLTSHRYVLIALVMILLLIINRYLKRCTTVQRPRPTNIKKHLK